YGSYSGEIIKGNFFTWFQDGFSKYTFFNLGSIGYFYSANQLSAIYLLGLPFIIISFLKKTSIKKGFVIVLSTLTMFLIGTRTATYGIFIILGSVLIIYFINSLLNKEKLKGKGIIFIVLLISIFLLLYPYSIVVNRNEVQEQIEITDIALPESSETSTSPLEKELTREDKILYIKDNYEEKRILPLFIISRYPYQNDPDFWYDILQLDASYRTNYRFLEQAIAKRVVSINNNKLDKYLGIGYNRMQNIFNIEKDFVMQYYSVGILGTVILLWFYLYYLVKGGILIIKNKGIKMEYALTVGFSLCLFFITAYQSGNLLNSLYTTIPCSILFGLLYEETKKDIN
ncbi:MAG: O-antigen ligase family protein, partial [Bacilli bacterium]